MPEFINRILEHINRIEPVITIDRPSLCFVALDESNEYIQFVAILGALGGSPASVNLRQSRAVIFIIANWPDFHVPFL